MIKTSNSIIHRKHFKMRIISFYRLYSRNCNESKTLNSNSVLKAVSFDSQLKHDTTVKKLDLSYCR